jgi:8-oxo-dGTP pyrophosphatase MutT (NUDIX family)
VSWRSDLVSGTLPTPAVPRQAATSLLLRDVDGGVEVYLLRRPARSSFAATAHVFPGGAVDEGDSARPTLARAPRFDPHVAAPRMQLEGDDASLRLCAGLHVAAVREAFEESGVLIGAHADGRPLRSSDADMLAAARSQLLAGAEFASVLEHHRLHISPERLRYIAHFITPEVETRRFDTRFFAVAAPVDQEAAHHAGEATHGGWYAPADVVARYGHDLSALLPPTRILCNEIAAHASVDAFLEDLGARDVTAVLFPIRDVIDLQFPDRLPLT